MSSTLTIINVVELNEVVKELRAHGNKVKVQKTSEGFLVSFDKGGIPMSKPKAKFSGYSGFSGLIPFESKAQAQAEYDKVKPQFGELVQLKGAALVYMTSREFMMSRAGLA